MRCSAETFVAHVARHAGVPSPELAEQATRRVLGGLGAYLSGTDRQLLADELPEALVPALAHGDLRLPIVERVQTPGMTVGHAYELIASVCRVLAEELSTIALRALRDAVPAETSRLLEPPAAAIPPGHGEARPGATLATGRPGSGRPISETPPPAPQSGSVAEVDPHGASKLSSAPGLTQERRHETLAEGRPGFDRPLADPTAPPQRNKGR